MITRGIRIPEAMAANDKQNEKILIPLARLYSLFLCVCSACNDNIIVSIRLKFLDYTHLVLCIKKLT